MELKYNSIFLKGENQGKEKENKRWLIKIISYGEYNGWASPSNTVKKVQSIR